MELFNDLIDEVDYSECRSRIEVAAAVRFEIENLDMRPDDALHIVLSELSISDIETLFESFSELKDAEHLKAALVNILDFEEKVGKYFVDVSDVLVGLMQLRATPDLRKHLHSLPLSNRPY